MFKAFIFNTNDASKACRQYLGIHGPVSTNNETMRVSVCFHRTRTAEPISMSYMGGIIIKQGLPHWNEFKVMLMECVARKEAEKKLDDECLELIPQLRAM